MVFNIPLFTFGVFIALVVTIGVLLALAEFRQVHAALPPAGQDIERERTRKT